jgi:TolA-binding protein
MGFSLVGFGMRYPAIGLVVLSLGACLAAVPARAQMDSREAIGLQNEIMELRQQMSQLQQFQAQAGGGGQSSLPPPMPEGGMPQAAGASGDVVAQLVVRVSNLEEQLRTLEGRISELENTEHRDHDDVAKQIGDLAFKLGQGGAAAPTAPGPGGTLAPPPGSGASPGMDLGYTPPSTVPSAAPPPAMPAHRPPELALKQGNAALARRDYASAEAAAREVLALGHGPRAVDANFLLARAQAGQHDYKEAAADYYGVYKANPRAARAAEALLGVANALIGLGDNAPACQALAKLGAEFPKPEAYVRAGVASARKRAACH